MKRVAFLNSLKKLKGEFDVNWDGSIRTKNAYECSGSLSGGSKQLCPLEALTLKDGKAVYFTHAEKILDIDEDLACLIIGAADGRKDGRKNSLFEYQNTMRNNMLKALGLKEMSNTVISEVCGIALL